MFIPVFRSASTLVIFLLLIAYGRCVADQFGMLHSSEVACCQVIYHDEHSADVTQPSTVEHDSRSDDGHPALCQLCVIISTDGATFNASIKVPVATVLEFTDSAFFAQLPGTAPGLLSTADVLSLPRPPDPVPPGILVSQWLQVASRVFPVRGPSMA